MLINVRLLASFRVDRFRDANREYPSECLIREVVEDLNIREEKIGLVLLNGHPASLSHVLSEGDLLSLVPFVCGG
jgi:molybdopterin synthase sulfur carrier subunit